MPFKPKIKDDKLDVSNFDEKLSKLNPKESLIDSEQRKRIIEKTNKYTKDFNQIVDS